MKAELDIAWAERSKLYAEGHKLRAEADKHWAEAHRLMAEGHKLRAEADKHWAEADKLYAEGCGLWLDAVHRVCGPGVNIEWTRTGCIVAGVMEFLNETS